MQKNMAEYDVIKDDDANMHKGSWAMASRAHCKKPAIGHSGTNSWKKI
jgi:hypothetical protein